MQFDSRVGLPIKRFSFALSLNWSRTLYLDRNILVRAWCLSVKSAKKGAVIAAINRLQKKRLACENTQFALKSFYTGLFAETSIHIQMRTIFICFRALFFLFAFLFFVPVYFNLPVSFKSIKAKSDSLHLHFWFVSTSLHKNAQGVFFAKWR